MQMQLYYAVMAFLCFVVAIFAVVLSFQLYALLKTGAIGKTWQLVIVAMVLYGVERMVYFAQVWEFIDPEYLHPARTVLELIFIATMAWALYLQRQAFFKPGLYRYNEAEGERGFPSRFDRTAANLGGEDEVAAEDLEERLDRDE